MAVVSNLFAQWNLKRRDKIKISLLFVTLSWHFFLSVSVGLLAQQQPVTEHFITAISAKGKGFPGEVGLTAARNNWGGLNMCCSFIGNKYKDI